MKPVWMYGVELWGTSSKSNIEIKDRTQTMIIRSILNATNFTIYRSLKMLTVHNDTIQERALIHRNKLETHSNPIVEDILLHQGNRRRIWSLRANLLRSLGYHR